MKLRLLYHNPRGEFKLWPPRLVGALITGYTWALALVRFDFKSLKHHFSHVELWEPDNDGNFVVDGKFVGFCHSSTTRGDSKGVRIAPAHKVLKHPERHRYLEFDTQTLIWKRIRTWIEGLVKKKTPYDYWGVFGFLWPWNTQDDNKYFCSELIHYLLWRLGTTEKKYKRISPRRSAKITSKLFGPLKPL